MIEQISVFLENRPGTLTELTDILTENNINMHAFSLADTYDFGIARIIVSKPKECIEVLKKNSYVANITNVIAVDIENRTGALNTILHCLDKAKQNIEYMYAFTGHKENSAYMIFRTADTEASNSILKEGGFHLIGIEDLDRI